MREMLKRRQFIFGKQNINRHQPYVDDVVINISDEDAVMKFAPTKRQVIDSITGGDSDGAVYNISENDIEFVDTFLYKDNNYDHIGYVYKLTKGSYTFGGHTEDLSNVRIWLAGPILALDEKVAFVTAREYTEEDTRRIVNVLGGDSPFLDPALPNKLNEQSLKIVTGFMSPDTSVSITQLPDPSYIVNITTDVLPHIINHIYLYKDGGDK